jgi:hypothetical protein
VHPCTPRHSHIHVQQRVREGASSIRLARIEGLRVARDPFPAVIAHSGADLIGGKPPILKESRLLCTFGYRTRAPRAELSLTDVPGKLFPIHFGRRQRPFYRLVRNSLLAELCPNSHRSLTALRVVMYETGYESVVRNQPLRPELLDDSVDGLGIVPLRGELPLQLFGSMLPPRQQPNSGGFDALVVGHLGWRLGGAGARSARWRALTIRYPLTANHFFLGLAALRGRQQLLA